jgi:glycosyltransferase involved in cell wall biosynthesis
MTITILMPVRDFHPDFLRAALDSIVNQTSDDWRLSLLADADRVDVITQQAKPYLADSRIGLIVNEGRRLAGKFNTGMRHADTEFVAILLGDDMWAPTAAAVLKDQIGAHPETDFFHSSRIFVDEHGKPISSVYRSQENVVLADFGTSSPVTHLFCWRRQLALSFGGMDERLNSVGVDDFDFPWLMAEHGARFHAIPDCLYIVRDHRDGFRLTTHLPLSVHARGIERILRKHGFDKRSAREAVREAQGTYLRQCLYRSRLDRWLKETVGIGKPPPPWFEPYE